MREQIGDGPRKCREQIGHRTQVDEHDVTRHADAAFDGIVPAPAIDHCIEEIIRSDAGGEAFLDTVAKTRFERRERGAFGDVTTRRDGASRGRVDERGRAIKDVEPTQELIEHGVDAGRDAAPAGEAHPMAQPAGPVEEFELPGVAHFDEHNVDRSLERAEVRLGRVAAPELVRQHPSARKELRRQLASQHLPIGDAFACVVFGELVEGANPDRAEHEPPSALRGLDDEGVTMFGSRLGQCSHRIFDGIVPRQGDNGPRRNRHDPIMVDTDRNLRDFPAMTTATAQLRRCDAATPVADIVTILLDDGGVIVEGLLDARQLDQINAEVDPFVESAEIGAKQINAALDEFFGPRTRHVDSLTGRSPAFVDHVLLHPAFAAVCDAVLLPNCARYQLNIASILDRGPGATAQMLHRDEDVWIHFPQPRPHLQVASVWALVDLTEANGATRVVPGSHRDTDRWRAVGDAEVAVAHMPAGSAVFYLGSTLHGGGANTTTDEWRRAFHLSFCLGWLRTEENNYLGTPPEVARTLPRAAQELIGYAVHDAIADFGGYLGILHGSDPVEMLADGTL